MPEHQSHPQTIRSAPRPGLSLVAALLGPAVAVLTYLALLGFFGKPIVRADVVLCLLVLALSFPGRNRFQDRLQPALFGVVGSWVGLLAVLALAAVATSSVDLFEPKLLLWWALLTPVAQGLVVWAGQQQLRRLATHSRNRRRAVVIGAGTLGVRVANALIESRDRAVDFVGFFDDRTDERVHVDAAPRRLGALKDAGAYVREHAVREVYIALPLGSQARILELLQQVQGTAASVFFVPDAFGIEIIHGQLQDVNGVAVVGIHQPPLSGVGKLVKQVTDRLLIVPLLLGIALAAKPGLPGLPGLPEVQFAAAGTFLPGASPNGRPQAIDTWQNAIRRLGPRYGRLAQDERIEALGGGTASSRPSPWRERSFHRNVAATGAGMGRLLAASFPISPSKPRAPGGERFSPWPTFP